MSDLADLEGELIKRNREIAKVRDDLLKTEKRYEECKMRNDDLLEKVSELDAEVTKKTTRIQELETQVEEMTTQMDQKSEELGELRKEHCENIEKVRKEMEDKITSSQEDSQMKAELDKKVAELEAARDEIMKDLEKERTQHTQTKSTLEQAESSSRDSSGRLVETRRRVKELEDQVADVEAAKLSHCAAEAEKAHSERLNFQTELQEMQMELEMQKSLREDLETMSRENEGKVEVMRVKLEDAQREIADHSDVKSALEAARDEAEQKYNQMKSSCDDALSTERARIQENYQKAVQKAADIEGRLNGQRVILDETTEALMKSEQEEERLKREMEDQSKDFDKVRESLKASIEEEKEKAEQEMKTLKTRHLADLEAGEVSARHTARTEIDAAERSKVEAEDRHRSLESEMAQMRLDHEEAMAHHQRFEGTAKGQASELKQKLHESEEKITKLEQELEQHQKDLQEKGLESERVGMSHKLEMERLQQTLEAEGSARAAAEKITQSKLEEKDTLIEHRVATIERLEHDLEEAKKKAAVLEEQIESAKSGGEDKAHQLGMRVAQLEGELRMRQDRLTEAEGRLEAQRAYLEEVNETLSKVRNEKDGLMETKGSLEAQLRLEVSHKDALNQSLQQSADESEKRCRDLEERLLRDRDLHKDQLDEARRSVGEEMKQGTERLAAVEAELLTARQRCELLARNKADLLQEVAENNSKLANVDAKIKEQADKNDTLSLELDQTKQARDSLEEELRTLRDEKRQCDARIDELSAEVKSKEDAKDALQDDFKLKVQRLDDLLNEERKLRQSTEETLGNARNDSESKSQESLNLRRKMEQELLELRSSGDTWKDKADDLGLKLQSTKEQLEAQKARTDEIDSQRREIESKLRGDLATSEARLRRVEQESQRATAAVEEGRATLAETQATMTARITSLEQELAQNKKDAQTAASARELAQKDLQSQTDSHRQNAERLGMAAEELFTRQVEFALEKQRLSGALEESRRTLRNSLITPNPSTAIDTVRVQTLEKQLAEERRKSIEQAVALQRSDRKCTQLEDSNKRSEEHRQAAIQNSRDAERRCVTLAEDLRKAQLKQNLTDQKCEETRERASMGAAEIQTVKYLSKYECAKLRGHLEELRYMIKRTDGARK